MGADKAGRTAVAPPGWGVLWLKRVAALAVLFLLWQLASGSVIRPFFISRPSDIALRLVQWARTGDLTVHLGETFVEMTAGFSGGTVLGVVFGMLLGMFPVLERISNPVNVAINALPKIALAPLFILAFGIGVVSKVMLVISVVVYFVLFNTIAGVRESDRDLLAVMRVMGATRRQLFTKVVAPGAAGRVFAGMKLGVRYALGYAVVGEMLAGNRGIGFLVQRSAGNLDTTGVFAAVVLLMLYGLLLYGLVGWLESFMLRWKLQG